MQIPHAIPDKGSGDGFGMKAGGGGTIMASGKEKRNELRCSVCGKTFSSDVAYGEHIKNHEWKETPPSPVPATERYHEGNPGITAGVAQHEAGGQFSGEPSPTRRAYAHRRKATEAKREERKRR